MEETWRRVCQGLSEPDVGDLERRQDEVKVEADFEISHSGSEPFRGAFSFLMNVVLSVTQTCLVTEASATKPNEFFSLSRSFPVIRTVFQAERWPECPTAPVRNPNLTNE
jgi:hypothetical protein